MLEGQRFWRSATASSHILSYPPYLAHSQLSDTPCGLNLSVTEDIYRLGQNNLLSRIFGIISTFHSSFLMAILGNFSSPPPLSQFAGTPGHVKHILQINIRQFSIQIYEIDIL
jgi:hypothetical protein